MAEDCAIFNYRLSRARRIIENSFGILAARWRILRRHIIAYPYQVILYTQAAVALHNFLRSVESSVYCPPGFADCEDGYGNVVEGAWRTDDDNNTGLQSISSTGSNSGVINSLYMHIYDSCKFYYDNRYSRSAAETRDCFKNYFCSPTGDSTNMYGEQTNYISYY